MFILDSKTTSEAPTLDRLLRAWWELLRAWFWRESSSEAQAETETDDGDRCESLIL